MIQRIFGRTCEYKRFDVQKIFWSVMRRYKLHTAAGSSAQDLEALLGEGQYDVNLRDR